MAQIFFKILCFLAAIGLFAFSDHDASFAQNVTASKESKALELEAVQRKLKEARQRQRALEEEISSLDRDVGAINRALVETAKRGQELEELVTNSEARLDALLQTQTSIKASLNKKRGLLSEILAGLQRLGKNPPPALLIQPEDALASVRSSILLGAVVPTIKQESDTLSAELLALKHTSLAVKSEKKNLAESLNALAEDETRLSLLVEEKKQLVTRSSEDLLAEQKLSTDLATKALSLKELIRNLETQIISAAEVAKSAKLADEGRRLAEAQRLEDTKKRLQAGNPNPDSQSAANQNLDMSRIEPAIAFSKAKGQVLYPVSGVETSGFGSVSAGSRRTDVTFVTRANARVRAPCDSWVVYAGPFRSYGQIVILNAGEGYHVVLSGLSQIDVSPGRFVLSGEPIGRMGLTGFAAATTTDLGSNRPILAVELRKDGKPINPAPWWAKRPNTNTQVSSGRGT